jgi:hypothetical protein
MNKQKLGLLIVGIVILVAGLGAGIYFITNAPAIEMKHFESDVLSCDYPVTFTPDDMARFASSVIPGCSFRSGGSQVIIMVYSKEHMERVGDFEKFVNNFANNQKTRKRRVYSDVVVDKPEAVTFSNCKGYLVRTNVTLKVRGKKQVSGVVSKSYFLQFGERMVHANVTIMDGREAELKESIRLLLDSIKLK